MKKIQVISRIKEIRKGQSEQRKNVVFEEGEPAFIIDKNRLYVGDNKSYGGVDAVCKNHIIYDNVIPKHGIIFDIIYNKKTKCVSIIDKKDTIVNINDYECKINSLSTLIDKLSSIDSNDSPIATDLDSIIFEDNIFTDVPDTIDKDQI